MQTETQEGAGKDPVVPEKKPKYLWHRGSIRVSGKSQVFKTGLSAYHEFKRGTRPVEFVFFGGNAGHQAFKACVIAIREIEQNMKIKVGCLPLWSTVLSDDTADGQAGFVKDVSIWRIVELSVAAETPVAEDKKQNVP